MKSLIMVALVAASLVAAQENQSSTNNNTDTASKFGLLVSGGYGVASYLTSSDAGASEADADIADQTKTGRSIDAIFALYHRKRRLGFGLSYRRMSSSGETSVEVPFNFGSSNGTTSLTVKADHTLNFIGPVLLVRKETGEHPFAFLFQVSVGRAFYEEEINAGYVGSSTINASGLGWSVGGSVERKLGQRGALFLQATMLRSTVEADKLVVNNSPRDVSALDPDHQDVSNIGLSAGLRFYL